MLYAILAYHVEAEVKSWNADEDAAVMRTEAESAILLNKCSDSAAWRPPIHGGGD